MSSYKTFQRIVRQLRKRAGFKVPINSIHPMAISAAEARAELQQTPSDLVTIFTQNEGRTIHKWLHYFPIYEQYFTPYRGTDFKMLEIGVFKGGSLEMWRKYFGPDAIITGVDINPECAGFVDPPNRVAIGSQADPAFMRNVVAEMGGLDVVLDDGSHIAKHQRASFDILFPLLAEGGLYIIEDTHTAYWPIEYAGGYRRSGTAIELAKTLIDDMHHWYHEKGVTIPGGGEIGAIHIHDSIIAIEKRRVGAPRHAMIPEPMRT